jgi:hypothetical protein
MADAGTTPNHDQEYADKTTTTGIANGHLSRVSSIATPPLQSDLTINLAKLRPSAITPETSTFNRKLQEIESRVPKWYEVSTKSVSLSPSHLIALWLG